MYIHAHVFMVTFITRVVKQPGSSDRVMEVELHTCSKLGGGYGATVPPDFKGTAYDFN